MLDKGKISALQMAMILYSTVLASGFLALPSVAAQYAGNDFWMTSLAASIMGIATAIVVSLLHKRYPGQNLIQYSCQIVGTIPGKIVGGIVCFFYLHTTGLIAREYAEFVVGNFLFQTPVLLVISSLLVLCAFSVYGGLEVMVRSAVIFFPIFLLPMFFILFLVPSLDMGNVFPFLSHGFVPVIKGASMTQAWYCEIFIISFFLPRLKDQGKGFKWAMVSFGMIAASMTFVNLILLGLLGPDTGNKMYPILVAFRYIKFGEFFENLESLLLAMWVIGHYIKISAFLYAGTISFTQVFGLSDYRRFVFPLGILTIIFGMWGLPDFVTIAGTLRQTGPFYLPFCLLVVPTMLLAVSLLRTRIKSSEGT